MIRIIGIDCATKEAKIGIVSADYDGNICCVAEFNSNHKKAIDRIAALLDGVDTALLCLDAPLGWPKALSKSLIDHVAGQVLSATADEMFSRTTDRIIQFAYKKPLEVGADRIARTAHHALGMLESLRNTLNQPIQIAWDHNLKSGIWAIEVYPAATAKAHGILMIGIKDKQKSVETIAQLLPVLATKLQLPKDQSFLSASEHNFDALLCVLAGVDFLTGAAMPPDQTQKEDALKEGWIWVKRKEPRRNQD